MLTLRHISAYVAAAVILLMLACRCTSDKFLSEGESVLSAVKVRSTDRDISITNYERCIRQRPNSKWFGLVKVPLGIYCLAGKDTSRHRRLHKLGQPPVIYDPTLTEQSVESMTANMISEGYLHGYTTQETKKKGHRTSVTYTLHPGPVYNIDSIAWDIAYRPFRDIILGRKSRKSSLLYRGMPCNISTVETERNRIVRLLQDEGYYFVNRDFVTFTADTSSLSHNVALTVRISYLGATNDSVKAHTKYHIGRINIFFDCDRDSVRASDVPPSDTISDERGGHMYVYGRKPIRDKILLKHLDFREGEVYSHAAVQSTFRNLSGLSITDYSSVDIHGDKTYAEGRDKLLADVNINTRGVNSIGFEVEGTNMAGDLGAAAALSFENRNLFRGAETFGLKLRGAFEALGGLEDYNNKENYLEFSIEANIKMPMLVRSLQKHRRNSLINSELSLMYNTQDRPEFHRRTLTASLLYTWNSWQNRLRHRLDLMSLNYVFMPWISDTFRREYLENNTSRNSILRYSYEDLFIMRSAYSLVYNSSNAVNARQLNYKSNAYSMKFSAETAGNLLYLLSRIFHARKNADGHYKLFNIAFAQYAKADIDFVKNFVIDERNAIALHTSFGLALPYGNASIVPYEKRYFAGGANSVRGWQVRGLGPGKYHGSDGKIDFINQTGNLKFDFSIEYRTFLFWKLHGAVFADAGNIWTTRNYSDQPGGKFSFRNFYNQLAASYGLGLRLNLDYFILRFDGGMKAVNPYYGSVREHFPLFHPRFSRDFTLHFAVGLPF